MEREQFEDQVKTKYPYSRLQIFEMFKRPVDKKNQRLFTVKQSIDIIQKQLLQLNRYYRNVQLKYNKDIPQRRYQGKMNRKIYGSFRCHPCRNSFTSILGNYEIHFTKDQKLPILFNNKIYRLKCLRCSSQCQGSIFQSQMQAVAKSFCKILAEIKQGIKNKKRPDDRHKLIQNHWHREELCEACRKGVCFNIPKSQPYLKQRNLKTSGNFERKKQRRQMEQRKREQVKIRSLTSQDALRREQRNQIIGIKKKQNQANLQLKNSQTSIYSSNFTYCHKIEKQSYPQFETKKYFGNSYAAQNCKKEDKKKVQQEKKPQNKWSIWSILKRIF